MNCLKCNFPTEENQIYCPDCSIYYVKLTEVKPIDAPGDFKPESNMFGFPDLETAQAFLLFSQISNTSVKGEIL